MAFIHDLVFTDTFCLVWSGIAPAIIPRLLGDVTSDGALHGDSRSPGRGELIRALVTLSQRVERTVGGCGGMSGGWE